jgi:DNA end-binding protein Ku
MARAIWSGTISFGLVNIPVKMYTAVRSKDIHFHQLHKKDQVRVKYRVVCPAEDAEVSRDDIVKGYEIGPDQYVIVTDEELGNLAPDATRAIEISDFIDLSEIDPIYYDRPYYLVPDEGAAKSYRLLTEAMEQSGKVAIAKFVMRQKEYLGALRPKGNAILLEIMHFAEEVVSQEELERLPTQEVSDKELKMARQLIESMSSEFEPQKYHNEYRERVQELIDAKAEGEEVVVQPRAPEPERVIDLMSALEKSLETAKKEQAARKKKKSA